MRVSIEPGIDLVGRFGDTVVLISRGDGTADANANELLGLVAALAADREAPATVVAARLAGWVLDHMSGSIPAFGIVAPVPEGVVVFLRGPVWCSVGAGDATRQLSGEQALTWVDQIIPGAFDWLAIGGADGTAVHPDPLSDLRAGVVPGRGLVLAMVNGPNLGAAVNAAAAPAAAAAQPQDAPEPEPEHVEPAAPAAPIEQAEPAEAEHLAEPAEPVMPSASDQPGNGISRVPIAETIASGAVMAEEDLGPGSRRRRGTGPARQVHSVLRSQDGLVIPLDRPYVLGREPSNDPAVRNGDAAPIRLMDPENLISRVHAYVSVANGTVLVRDANSAQGTYIGAPGAADWTRVDVDPAPLLPGWSLRIGHHVFILQPDGPPDA